MMRSANVFGASGPPPLSPPDPVDDDDPLLPCVFFSPAPRGFIDAYFPAGAFVDADPSRAPFLFGAFDDDASAANPRDARDSVPPCPFEPPRAFVRARRRATSARDVGTVPVVIVRDVAHSSEDSPRVDRARRASVSAASRMSLRARMAAFERGDGRRARACAGRGDSMTVTSREGSKAAATRSSALSRSIASGRRGSDDDGRGK